MEGGGITTTMSSKAEIDTRAPFRSVKEAVTLFGERVLASEIYANKLKEMQQGATKEYGHHEELIIELKATKHSLQKAQKESMNLALCLSSLQQELEHTKRELHQLKIRESGRHILLDLEIEDLKFIEDSIEPIEQVKKETTTTSRDQRHEFQKKKNVTFANPPSMGPVVGPAVPPPPTEAVLRRHPSLKKKKKKPFIPLIGGIFAKMRGNSEVYMA